MPQCRNAARCSRNGEHEIDLIAELDSHRLVDGGRDPVRIRRYLQACAANTAGIVMHKTLYDAAEVNRLTARRLRPAAGGLARHRSVAGVEHEPALPADQHAQASSY
ncbi:MAG: hypothetical protein ACRDQX_10890 [Pseudonocardiaceae bacterium]